MSIEKIKILSMNPHFYGLLFEGFLSGYNKPCDVKLMLMALPILIYKETREKLSKANKKSSLESLFNNTYVIKENIRVSSKIRFAGYLDRYKLLMPYSKQALIILSSEQKIILNQNKIYLQKSIKYKNYKNSIKEWVKAAYYLGIIFAKSTEEDINYFLGVA